MRLLVWLRELRSVPLRGVLFEVNLGLCLAPAIICIDHPLALSVVVIVSFHAYRPGGWSRCVESLSKNSETLE